MTGLAHFAVCGFLVGLSPRGSMSPLVGSRPGTRAPGARLSSGLSLERQGRIAAAYSELLAPIPRSRRWDHGARRRLELHRLWALSRAQRGLGLFAAAAETLHRMMRLDPGGLLGARARITRADDLLVAGRAMAAARAFRVLRRRFPACPSPGRWMVSEAEALLLLGRASAAAALLRRVVQEHPLGPDGARAGQILALLPDRGRTAMSPGAGSPRDLELARLRRLGRGGALVEARAGLRRLVDEGRLSAGRAVLEEARLLMATYRYREAVPLLRRLTGSARGSVRVVARRLLPGALFRADRLSAYLRSPRSRSGPKGRARRVQALILLGRYEEAVRILDRRAGDAQPVRRAYLWYRAGRLARAARRLVALTQGPGGRAARYWLAVVHARQGRSDARGELWRLASGPVLDWYALMARSRLGAGPDEPAPKPVSPWAPLGRGGEETERLAPQMRALARRLLAGTPTSDWRRRLAVHLLVAAHLLRFNLRDSARWELRELVRRYLVLGVGGRRGRLLRPLSAAEAWAGVRHRAGVRSLPGATGAREAARPVLPRLEALLYRVFRRLGSPYLANRFASRRQGRPRLLTPRPYESRVLSVARRAHLAPGRLWAVMAVESAFWPWVVSSAGAMGLLQVMPLTARRIAGAMSNPRFRLEDLFSVEISLRMGGWYLGQLTRRFSGQFPLAVASYNGGPHRLAVWGEIKRKSCKVDQFVEEIPFRETRRYVKRVVARAARYAVERGEPYGDLLSLRLRPSVASGVDF